MAGRTTAHGSIANLGEKSITRSCVDAIARDGRAGLSKHPKELSSCYFYDAEGSHLFEEICALPEYYLTRAEAEILQHNADALAAHFTGPITLIELGSGNAAKTRF